MNMRFLQSIFLLTFLMGNISLADNMIIDDMKNQSGQPDEEFCEGGNAKSVSYTHLTLPTNREV